MGKNREKSEMKHEKPGFFFLIPYTFYLYTLYPIPFFPSAFFGQAVIQGWVGNSCSFPDKSGQAV